MKPTRSLWRSTSEWKYIAIWIVLASLVLFIFHLFRTVDFDLLLRFSHRLPILPTAQAEYQHILDKIATATSDELLDDQTEAKPQLYREGLGCIIVLGNRTYGTNRTETNILKDYARTFLAMGWKKESDNAYSIKTASVMVVFIDPRASDYWALGKGKYQTLYRVQLIYADPQPFGCFG